MLFLYVMTARPWQTDFFLQHKARYISNVFLYVFYIYMKEKSKAELPHILEPTQKNLTKNERIAIPVRFCFVSVLINHGFSFLY